MINLDDRKLGEVLKDKKYYRSGIRSDFGELSIELEESYHGHIVDKMLNLYNKEMEFQTARDLENLIYDVFKKAFIDAVRFINRDKRRVQFVDVESFIEKGEDEIKMPDNMKHEDIDFDVHHVDNIDVKLRAVKKLLKEDEYNYLDLRLNSQCSVAEVMEDMDITKSKADGLLKSIKRKCSHLKSDTPKYTLEPYGEIDSRNSLELFHMSEELKNQYVNYASSDKLAIHIEDVDAFGLKKRLY
jgi:hypothetical protein